MSIKSFCYALSISLVGLAVSSSILAQSSNSPLSLGGEWTRIETSGLIDYAIEGNEGIIIRSPDFTRSTNQALKEHLYFGIQEDFDRPLTPAEQENVRAVIERYASDKLRSVVIEGDSGSSQAAVVVVRGASGGKERQRFANAIAGTVFSSKEFTDANAEEKWELLQRKVQEEALNPSTETANGEIELGAAVSVMDVIRQVEPEQLSQLFDIESWPEWDWLDEVTAQVVAPGTPVSGNGKFGGSCMGRWCGSPAPRAIPVEEDENADAETSGRAQITYREDAYSNVVVLQPGKIGFARKVERCTATLIARSWAVSALHCFGESGKDVRYSFKRANGPIPGWTKFIADERSIFAVARRTKDEKPEAFLVEEIYVPYSDAREVRYRKGEMPPKDVALVKIEREIEDDFLAYPEFATESESKKDAAVTFVGYGWTNVAREDWTKSQEVAFNWLTKGDTKEVLWRTRNFGGNGGPCAGDSGGPIFLTFVRGYADETQRMVGVVSGLRGIGKIQSPSDCLEKEGVGEPVFSIASDICSIMNDESERCQ